MISFSVVVSSYNYRSYIVEALESALRQTRAPLEIIVVDDGSTDGSADLVAERFAGEPSIRLIRQANAGQLAAFHVGVREAAGDVVAFLDSDDLWEAGYLERVGQVYDAHRGVDFVYTDMQVFGKASGRYSDLFRCEKQSRDLGFNVLRGSLGREPPWLGTASSAMSLKRRLARQLLALPPEMFPAFDKHGDICLVRGADIWGARKYFLAEALCRYRAHGGNAWLLTRSYDFTHRVLKHRAITYYRTQAGICDRWLVHAKREFRSRADPTRAELSQYLELVGQADLPAFERWRQYASLWRHYLRGGRAA